LSNTEKIEKKYLIYIKAILRGMGLSILLVFLCSILFYFTALSDEYIDLVAFIITVAAICYSGIYVTYRIGSRGLIHGALVGGVYVLLLMCIGFVGESGELSMVSYCIMFIAGILVGALAGVIGTLINKG
jgi:putative membrane protein (TIGR04086 family)